jgi:hypothetical protein
MGILYNNSIEILTTDKYETFIPMLTWNRSLVSPPVVFYFQEFILQSIIRQWLSLNSNLKIFFDSCGLNNIQAKDFEVLGEKALPEGHVDIIIKDCAPAGYNRKIIVEVKLGKANPKDIIQLKNYMIEIGAECIGGVLIARDYSKKVQQESKNKGINCFVYSFDKIDKVQKYSLEHLKSNFQLSCQKEL